MRRAGEPGIGTSTSEDGKRVVYVDEAGTRLDADWANAVLGDRELGLEVREAPAFDVEPIPTKFRLPRRREVRLLTARRSPVAVVECDYAEIAGAAKRLIERLEDGGFDARIAQVRMAERIMEDVTRG